MSYDFFFFFQAEDGIRDYKVTGVQTCALPILVLLQLDHLELRELHRQLLEVVQRGAAPAVDALVVVAHGGEAGAGGPRMEEHTSEVQAPSNHRVLLVVEKKIDGQDHLLERLVVTLL